MGTMRALAIDGPAGAGKSTVAKAVSRELGWIYVDTGAMFRAVALSCLKKGIDPADREQIGKAAGKIQIEIVFAEGEQRVILDGTDVTGELRTEAVGNMASAVSVYPEVRKRLLELQREIAAKQPVVMDGRDIGTVVLPDADTKVYLTASTRVRALRRMNELKEKGIPCSLPEIEKDIEERDQRDMNRAEAPLKKAEDAVLVDSSSMTLKEVIDCILGLVKKPEGTLHA